MFTGENTAKATRHYKDSSDFFCHGQFRPPNSESVVGALWGAFFKWRTTTWLYLFSHQDLRLSLLLQLPCPESHTHRNQAKELKTKQRWQVPACFLPFK